MTIEPPSQAEAPALPPLLPLILALFVGSGCAALIYEIVWFQLLQLVIGSSAVSLGVLLGTFMGGMCLGSLLLPRWLSTARHPLRVYAALELAIGLIGVVVLHGMPLVGQFYTEHAASDSTSVLMRGLVCAICLLPPTVLMGATLPAIARWVHSSPEGVSWLGFFYGGNIAGAVAGCLLAGFYLLRVYDMYIATGVAVTINFIVATCGFVLSMFSPFSSRADHVQKRRSRAAAANATSSTDAVGVPCHCHLRHDRAGGGGCLDTASFIDARRTVYTFSIILAVFLVGLGIGSATGSVLVRSRIDLRTVAGVVSTAVVGHDRLGGFCLGAIAAVLANRCLALAEPLVWISTRFAPHCLGDFSGGLFVGEVFRWRWPRRQRRGTIQAN